MFYEGDGSIFLDASYYPQDPSVDLEYIRLDGKIKHYIGIYLDALKAYPRQRVSKRPTYERPAYDIAVFGRVGIVLVYDFENP